MVIKFILLICTGSIANFSMSENVDSDLNDLKLRYGLPEMASVEDVLEKMFSLKLDSPDDFDYYEDVEFYSDFGNVSYGDYSETMTEKTNHSDGANVTNLDVNITGLLSPFLETKKVYTKSFAYVKVSVSEETVPQAVIYLDIWNGENETLDTLEFNEKVENETYNPLETLGNDQYETMESVGNLRNTENETMYSFEMFKPQNPSLFLKAFKSDNSQGTDSLWGRATSKLKSGVGLIIILGVFLGVVLGSVRCQVIYFIILSLVL